LLLNTESRPQELLPRNRTSEFIEKYCDLLAEEKKKLLGFMAEQYEISHLHNSKDKLSELSHRLRKTDG